MSFQQVVFRWLWSRTSFFFLLLLYVKTTGNNIFLFLFPLFSTICSSFYRLLHLRNIHTSHRRTHQKNEREREDGTGMLEKRMEEKTWNFILSFSLSLVRFFCVCASKKKIRKNFDSSIHIHTYTWNQSKCPLCSIINVHWCKKKNNTKKKQRHLIDGSSDRRDKKVCCIYSCI